MEYTPKKVLVTICSRNPNFDYLSQNIDYFHNLLQGYQFCICIVDSDSDVFTEYQKIEQKYPEVIIHYVKNKNYEYGAYKYAYQTHPNYDIYVCIQDTTIFTKKINLENVTNNQAFIFRHHSGFLLDHKCIRFAMKVLSKSPFEYPDYAASDDVCKFPFAQHCSFITTKQNMEDIFKSLTIPPKTKLNSRSYERLFGLYFIFRNINTINLREEGVKKYHGKRK